MSTATTYEATGAHTGARGASARRLRLVKLVRISKDRDNETSTATQNYELDAAVAAHNADVVETFTEVATSGFKDIPRPKLDDALAMVRDGFADGIIVWKVSRFTRKGAMELFRMLGYCQEGNGFLIAASDGIDTRTAGMADIIKLTVIAELAKGESEAKRDLAASWHRGRLRGEKNNGKPMPPAGRRPFGYDRPNANTLIPNVAEAATVKRMAEDFASGRKSMRAIVRELNEADATGRNWTHRGVRYVLTSPTNLGGRMVGGAFVKSNWPPIIDRATFDACCAKLADPARRTMTDNRPSWLLTGIATCGRDGCDGSFRAKSHPTTGHRYTCKACSLSVIVAEADAVVGAYVLRVLSGDGWKALRASGRTHDASAVEFLTARRDHARTRWIAGKISDSEWDETLDAITAQIAEIQSAPVVELPDVDDLAAAWNHADPAKRLSIAHKRQVVQAATEAITFRPYRHGLTGYDRVDIS